MSDVTDTYSYLGLSQKIFQLHIVGLNADSSLSLHNSMLSLVATVSVQLQTNSVSTSIAAIGNPISSPAYSGINQGITLQSLFSILQIIPF